MKKLGKLNLMKEKMLSYEELISFRGGSAVCDCTIHWESTTTQLNGQTGFSNCSDASSAMLSYYSGLGATQVSCSAG